MLPLALVPALREQLARARLLWSEDRASGHAGVFMPDALDRKYPGRALHGRGSGPSRKPPSRSIREPA
jgi:hypothetical protein